MNETIYSLGLLNDGIGLLLSLLIGFFFGFFLEKAGFGSSRKLTGVFYFRDMAVIKVMFSAVLTAMLGYRYLVVMGWINPQAVSQLDTYWSAQAWGGLIFGVGFVMGGWCPGTALVGWASARWDALVFLAGAVIGSIVFNEMFGALAGLYEGHYAGVIYLPDSLKISWRVFPFLFSILGVLLFAGSTKVEKMFAPAGSVQKQVMNKVLAVLVILAAGGLVFLPEGSSGGAAEQKGKEGLYSEIEAERDHIDVEEVVDSLMSSDGRILLVDIRSKQQYDAFHIRGAINMPLSEIEGRISELPSDRTIVLYSNGTTHAAQAWLLLKQAGLSNVRVMMDGILGFWKTFLTPPSLSGTVDPAAAQSAGERYRAIRSFFIDNKSAPEPVTSTDVMDAPGIDQHLVTTEWLASNMDNNDIKMLDVRAESSSYSKEHIPGAVYINIENLRTTIDGYHSMLAPAEDIARSLGRMGITPRDTVIVYDDRLRDATYMAVALERVGHKNFGVLHGGFKAWKAEGRPLTSEVPKVHSAVYMEIKGADKFTVNADQVFSVLHDGKTVILDVRPGEYFTGAKSDEARAGHIPGAINRPFTDDLVKDKSMWMPVSVLTDVYNGLGIEGDKPVIVNCRTGHQASQTYFLLKYILGCSDVRWFDGSWMVWAARKDLPVEK